MLRQLIKNQLQFGLKWGKMGKPYWPIQQNKETFTWKATELSWTLIYFESGTILNHKVTLLKAIKRIFVVFQLSSRSTPNVLLSSSLGIHYFGSSSGNLETKKNIAAYLLKATVPLYFQPEWKATNGTGLLKFKTWPFALCDSVQPVSVTVRRPYFGMAVATADSTNLTNIFYYMFSPYTVYRFKFLPTVQKQNLSEEEFAERVRQNIASDLKVLHCFNKTKCFDIQF